MTLDGSQTTGCGALLSSSHVEDAHLRYLQVSVGGVALSPRLRLGSVPLAAFATQSADARALATALSTTRTLNDALNPMEWSRLKSVPDDFADGVDADTTYAAAPTGGLSLLGAAFSITNGGVTNAMLENPSVTVTAGTGLTGGGAAALGGATTLGLANTAVVPDSYTLANITVDAQGRITAASNGSVQSGTLTSITAGTGLPGGTLTTSGTIGISNNGVSSALLASDAASLAKVTGSAMSVAAGNVGVGTGAPATRLDVAGEARADYLGIRGQDGAGEGGEMRLDGTGGYGNLQIDNDYGHLRLHTLAAGKQLQLLGGGLMAQGTVESTSGGFKFPDGTVQTTAGGPARPGGQRLERLQADDHRDLPRRQDHRLRLQDA